MRKLNFLVVSLALLFSIPGMAQRHPHQARQNHPHQKPSQKSQKSNETLFSKISNISKSTQSVIGVSAIYIEKNKQVSYQGTMPVFMASTAKVPIAYALLNRVDKNQLSLSRVVTLTPHDSVPGSGGLRYLIDKKPMNLTLQKLLTLMMTKSDNSASDAVLRVVNGPVGVQQSLAAAGILHTKVNRSFREIFIDAHGADKAVAMHAQNATELEKMLNRVPLNKKIFARRVFDRDMRDTTTANDMALLLTNLYSGRLLSPASTHLLIHTMEECKTGPKRIKGLLPRGTLVAHKTGTWSLTPQDFMRSPEIKQLFRFTSDVGIITLPKHKGHIAIAVYVKSRSSNGMDRTKAIARISQDVYDYFLRSA